MAMITLLYILLSFNLRFLDFFSSDSEKELQKLQMVAESAMKRGDWSTAIDTYKDLICHIAPDGVHLPPGVNRQRVDWATYVDIHYRLVEALMEKKEYKTAEDYLKNLILQNPPESHCHKSKLLLAKSIAASPSSGSRAQEAFLLMKEVEAQWPIGAWTGDDRSFFHLLQFSLHEHFDTLYKKAKSLSIAGYYKEACHLLEKIVEAIEKGSFPTASNGEDSLLKDKTRFALAQNYYLLSKIRQAKVQVDEIENPQENALFLTAKLFSARHEYEKALQCYELALQKTNKEGPYYLESLLEIAALHLRNKNRQKAKEYLAPLLEIPLTKSSNSIAFMARLYSAKIQIALNELNSAQDNLMILTDMMRATDPLQGELIYLKAQLAFAKKQWQKAVTFYEQALLRPAVGREEIIYSLIIAYLKVQELDGGASDESLKRAEQLAIELPNENPYILAKASLFAYKTNYLQDERARADLFALYNESSTLAIDVRHKLQLMVAKSSRCLEEKTDLFEDACRPCFAKLPSYFLAWYLRGIFMAQTTLEKKEGFTLENTLQIINKAITLSCDREPNEIQTCSNEEKAHLLYLQAELLVERGASYHPICQLLEKQLHDSRAASIFPSILYLYATVLHDLGNDEKAKEHFLEIYDRFPENPIAPKALFFAAEIEKSPFSKVLFTQCYLRYPTSEIAPLAYLKVFDFNDYLSGQSLALVHLMQFEKQFVCQEQVIVDVLLGLQQEDVKEAERLLSRAVSSYWGQHFCSPASSQNYFGLRGTFELASLFSKKGLIEEARSLLIQIENRLEENRAALKGQGKPFDILYEENKLKLAKTFIALGNSTEAHERLIALLEYFARAGIQHHYGLARVWLEESRLAIDSKDARVAMLALEMAQQAGDAFFSQEERLDLWLLQSEAYFLQNKISLCMRMLSKVINEDVVSTLRLKAMFRRAEVYESEGKYHLAYRQLEALAKKGGTWGQLALEKLERDYIVNST